MLTVSKYLTLHDLCALSLLPQDKERKIKRQYSEVCKTQMRQFKALQAQVLQQMPKEKHKAQILKMKDEQRRKMAILGEQYRLSIQEISVSSSVRCARGIMR